MRYLLLMMLINASLLLSNEESSKIDKIYNQTLAIHNDCICKIKYSPKSLSENDPELIYLNGKMDACITILQYIINLPE